MSSNIQEPETACRKRSHGEFSGELMNTEGEKTSTAVVEPSDDSLLHPLTHNTRPSSSQESPASIRAGSSTPTRKSPLLETPTKDTPEQTIKSNQNPIGAAIVDVQLGARTNPVVKRKRLDATEKAARDKELADKKKEREEKASIRAAEKAKQDEEKAAKAKEREEKRKRKEEEDRLKPERKQKKEEEDRLKAEKKRKREEEQQRIQEEKDRKARSQKTLSSFFKIPSTPKKSDGGEAAMTNTSPTKSTSAVSTVTRTDSEYRKLFKPFFVKENTRLAPATMQMDEETRETKSRSLDEHMANPRNELPPFNLMDLLAFSSRPLPRGKLHQPVKHIMETAYRETQQFGNVGGADANKIFHEIGKQLDRVPMKVIAFSQDVRPPYYGTMTFKPFALGKGNMRRLARKSMGRRLPLDYDYDSEAEWQEEEGEDLDGEDEEEELDDEDDMDGFLDDSEDVGLSRRVFANILEPESTGICFENQTQQVLNPAVYENKMEFVHEGLTQQWGIDPFSTQYWEPEPKATKSKLLKTAKSSESEAKMLPPTTPANAFAGSSSSNPGPSKLVKAELLNDVKRAILDNKALSKVGIIDFIFHQFRDSVSRTEVKNTLEFVAEKKGTGRIKEWELRPGHEMAL